MSAKTINDNDGGSVDGGNDTQERILADEVSFTYQCTVNRELYLHIVICRTTTKVSRMRATVTTIAAILAAG